MTYQWLIVGGGIHGVHLAVRLLAEAEVSKEEICIIDPHEELLAQWRRCTSTTGMAHLRSPSVHHLGVEPWDLRRFAQAVAPDREDLYTPPYDRPALDVFDAHCEYLIRQYDLRSLHHQARVVRSQVECDGVRVWTDDGREWNTRRMVLCLGAGDHPRWPTWAPRQHSRVQHIFQSDFDRSGWAPRETVAVVGGGISAGQTAMRLAREGHDVHLITRQALKEAQFDSDPGWLGPKYMQAYEQERCLSRRRQYITQARHVGTMPSDVLTAVREAEATGLLAVHQVEVSAVENTSNGLCLRLDDGRSLEADRLLLATGFVSQRPGGTFVDELVEAAALPCAECGYPIVDEALRWHPHIHVTGPLAELELGPAARNIAGARRAADRVLTVAEPPIQ